MEHTVAMGTTLALLSPHWIVFLGPGPALAILTLRRAARARAVWPLLSCGALMLASSTVAFWSFGRQGDVHWLLWSLWALAAVSAVVAVLGAIYLRAAGTEAAPAASA